MTAKGDDVHVTCARFGIGLSWERSSTNVDVDLQAIAFSATGQIKDAVYYNNMKASFGAGLTHSGDEVSGEKGGLDEAVWVTFKKLPEDVKIIVYVIACYSGGHIKDVNSGKMHMLEDRYDNDIMQWALEDSNEEVDVMGLLYRDDEGTWWWRQIEEPAGDGQHFIDILEPTIGNCVRSIIPTAPRRIKACFAMEKGSVVDLPKSAEIKVVSVGLGWDTGGSGVDLDVTAVLLSSANTEHASVFFGNLEAGGVQHSGDNLTGEGSGDDETITINLELVDPAVHQVVFLINIYTRGKTFALVKNPYCRIRTDAGDELARYQLSDAGGENGLIVARILRATDGVRWSFQAVGMPCGGNMYKDSMRFVQELAAKKPKELQLRQLSSGSLGGPVEAAPPAAAAAPPPAKSSACQVQ